VSLRAGAILVLCLVGAGAATPAWPDPWITAGDPAVRSDILLLADAGILHGPVTTWPLSWPDIARDSLGAKPEDFDDATGQALRRIQRLARAASGYGYGGASVRASVASATTDLRAFDDTSRAKGEVTLRSSWLSPHLALNLQGTYAAEPVDRRELRPDGSYLGVNIGNFMVSVGYMERWWGPGWDGSLILSTNARPIPSITLERNYTDPFETKLLSWIGPWRASIAVGEAEKHDVPVAKVRFLAARVNFRPRPWLELGLTRTAQWCGGGRECGWRTFTDLLVGRDNQVEDGAPSQEQPGNQLAGYDARLRSPWRKLPLAVYGQWIGEDEAGGLPSKFLGLFGAEMWTSTALGALRVRVEFADTACNFSRQEKSYGCAYRNGIYPQGYAYRGRIIGHAMDNDSRMSSLNAMLTRPNGDFLSISVRRFALNRDGGAHAISDVPLDLDNVELRYSRVFGFGKVSVGAGFDDPGDAAGADTSLRGFVSWQQGF
jgi:hypothetical protein